MKTRAAEAASTFFMPKRIVVRPLPSAPSGRRTRLSRIAEVQAAESPTTMFEFTDLSAVPIRTRTPAT